MEEPSRSSFYQGSIKDEKRANRDARGDRSHLDPRTHRQQTGWQGSSIPATYSDQREQTKEVRRLGRERRWEEALHVMALQPEPNPVLRSVAVDACVKSMQSEAAWRVFNDMPEKTVPAYNSLLFLLGRQKKIASAEGLVAQMKDESLSPDFVTYTTLMSAYGASHQVDDALRVLGDMKAAQMPVDRITYGAAMSACAKAGEKDKVKDLLAEMDTMRVQADISHLTSLVVSCARSKDEPRAREAMQELQQRNVTADTIVYTAFIGCLSGNDRSLIEKAEAVLKEMKDLQVLPDTYAYNAVLKAAGDCCASDRFEAVLGELEASGLAKNQETSVVMANMRRAEARASEWQNSMAEEKASMTPQAVPEAALPEGWAQALDPASGRAYYWKQADPAGSTTWERPVA